MSAALIYIPDNKLERMKVSLTEQMNFMERTKKRNEFHEKATCDLKNYCFQGFSFHIGSNKFRTNKKEDIAKSKLKRNPRER